MEQQTLSSKKINDCVYYWDDTTSTPLTKNNNGMLQFTDIKPKTHFNGHLSQ